MGDAPPVRGFREVMEALGGEPLLKTTEAISTYSLAIYESGEHL